MMSNHLSMEDLRASLLNTLSDSRRQTAQAHLEDCAECQSALEVARNQLAVLDALQAEETPNGLAARTLNRILNRPRSLELSLDRLVVAASVILVLSAAALFALGKAREASRRATTQNNMKQFGLIFKMYANQSTGERWPLLAANDRVWAPNFAPLRETLVRDAQFMVSEQHPDRKHLKQALEKAWSGPTPDLKEAEALVGESFAYLGYSVSNEAEFEALRRAKARHVLPSDTEVPVANPEERLRPLREGIERFLITDINNSGATSAAQSTIPVLIEIATWKYKKSEDNFKGTNVLYMDGHVAFVPLGTFPVLPSILDVLSGS